MRKRGYRFDHRSSDISSDNSTVNRASALRARAGANSNGIIESWAGLEVKASAELTRYYETVNRPITPASMRWTHVVSRVQL